MTDLTNVIINQKETIEILINNVIKMFYRRNYIKNDDIDTIAKNDIIKEMI